MALNDGHDEECCHHRQCRRDANIDQSLAIGIFENVGLGLADCDDERITGDRAVAHQPRDAVGLTAAPEVPLGCARCGIHHDGRPLLGWLRKAVGGSQYAVKPAEANIAARSQLERPGKLLHEARIELSGKYAGETTVGRVEPARDLDGRLPRRSLDDRSADEEIVLLCVGLDAKMQTISKVNWIPQNARRSLREIAVGRDQEDFCRDFAAHSGLVRQSDQIEVLGIVFIRLPQQQHDRVDAF